MTAPELAKLTADELRRIATADFERDWDERSKAVDELHRRAQANDALRSDALREAIAYCRSQVESCSRPDPKSGVACGMFDCLAAAVTTDMERHFGLDAAAPAAPPTPAATVTDDDAPGGDDGVEPGAPIAHLTCPGCKGALEIVHGDEVGAVSAMWVLDGDTRLTVGRYTAAPLFKVTLEKDEQPKGAEVI